jgi:hypothetical protein
MMIKTNVVKEDITKEIKMEKAAAVQLFKPEPKDKPKDDKKI